MKVNKNIIVFFKKYKEHAVLLFLFAGIIAWSFDVFEYIFIRDFGNNEQLHILLVAFDENCNDFEFEEGVDVSRGFTSALYPVQTSFNERDSSRRRCFKINDISAISRRSPPFVISF